VPPVAYSYIRFSTPDQLKGDSLRRQLELSERYAKEHGLELDTSLRLKDLGLSAFNKANLEKGALGVFLEAVKVGSVKSGSFLLVESLDRLSRANVTDALNLFLGITNAGITIVTLADGMRYSQQSIEANWTQLIMSLAIMARAHEESATKSKRLKAVWAKKKTDANLRIVTSSLPAWLAVKDGKIVANEEKAETVREIFRLVRGGYGLHLLERKLNTEKIPAIGKAARWHRSYLNKLVHNRSIIGEYQPMTGRGGVRVPAGDPVKGYYPPLMTEAEFYSAQQSIAGRTAMGGRKGLGIANIFSGLCKCGYCGGPARYVNKNAATKWQYLVCSNAKSGLGCKHVLWNYHEFESTVLSKLAGLDIASILKDEKAEKDKNTLEATKAKLAATRKSVQSLIKMAEVADEVQELAARLVELKADQKAYEVTVRQLEDQAKAPSLGRRHFEQFRRLRASLDSASGEELTELRLRLSSELKRFLDRIEIFADGDKPWSLGMKLIGVQPGKNGRFAVVVFKTGDGRVLHGVNSTGTLWPGPKTDAATKKAASEFLGRELLPSSSDRQKD
jgi:DNA invertase Pin-like site-specific DNA recombinase